MQGEEAGRDKWEDSNGLLACSLHLHFSVRNNCSERAVCSQMLSEIKLRFPRKKQCRRCDGDAGDDGDDDSDGSDADVLCFVVVFLSERR